MGTDDLLENLTECWRVACDGLASRPGGVAILLAASCYRNFTVEPHYLELKSFSLTLGYLQPLFSFPLRVRDCGL